MRKIVAALLLALFIAPAAAQTCSPVPALPDTERRTQYSITASTGPLNVGFAIYGDQTDFVDWIQVFVNGTATTAYTLTSPSGSIATLCRPVTDARITFSAAQTGTVQIVGARRPRRTSQFSENRGVAARDVNQVISDLTAQLREAWDWRNRVIQGVPGDNFGVLSPASVRANTIFGFDANGNPTYLPLGPTISATAGSTFNTRGLAAAASISGTVQFITTAGFTTVGDGGGATYARTGGTTACGFQSADGSWWAITGPVIWAAMCGAICDGVTNDRDKFQSLLNAAVTNKSLARFNGTCIADGLVPIGPVDFGGVTQSTSILEPSNNANAIISWAQTSQVVLHDFAIYATAPGATGIAITCDGASTAVANIGSKIYNLRVESMGIGLYSKNCGLLEVSGSYFNSNTINNVRFEAPNCDSGDNFFHGNTFIAAGAIPSVLVHCAGGLRFIGNKWNSVSTAAAVAYRLGATVTNSNSTSHIFTGNSIEGSQFCFDMQRTAGTGLLANIEIKGNEMVCQVGIFIALSGTWVYGLDYDNHWYSATGVNNLYALVDGINGAKIQGSLVSNTTNAVAANIGTTNAGVVVGPFSKGTIGGSTWAASTLNSAISVTCSATCF